MSNQKLKIREAINLTNYHLNIRKDFTLKIIEYKENYLKQQIWDTIVFEIYGVSKY